MSLATRQKSLVSAVPCKGGHVAAGPRLLGWQRATRAHLSWVQRRGLCQGGAGSRERGRETPVGNLPGLGTRAPQSRRALRGISAAVVAAGKKLQSPWECGGS